MNQSQIARSKDQVLDPADMPKAKHYKAIIRGGEPLQLTPSQADTIGLDMIAGNSGKSYKLKQHDLYLRVGDVRRIEPDYEAEILEKRIAREAAERQQKLLLERKRNSKCKAQYSIQSEINRIAKDVSGRKSDDNPDGVMWMKLIGDKDWRAMIYEKLRDSDVKWCDDRRNECACDDAYEPAPGRHNV